MRSRWTKGAVGLVLVVALSVVAAWGARHLGGGPSRPVTVTGTIEATQVAVSVEITGRIVERIV